MAFGTILPLGGRIGDIYGYKKVLITDMTGFLLAAILGGASTNFIMLAISRAGQGIFAAILAPSVLALISLSFTDNATRSKAFAAYGSVSGAGGGIGALISLGFIHNDKGNYDTGDSSAENSTTILA